MRSSFLLALAASLSPTWAVYQGFNYGSTQTDGSIKSQTDFENEFKTAQNLVGTSGFTSARLYTSIQAGTSNSPIAAIQAAINTKTSLLLGIWTSGGPTIVNNEIAALQSAIAQYGTQFTSLVVGLSVGSEDLYRISPAGLIAPDAAPGVGPDTLVSYIKQVKSALQGTPLSNVKIGHVDTWTAWVNGSNSPVVDAVDFLGVDAYPYFQSAMSNSIDSSYQLFFDAYDATVGSAKGKDVWVTETGFPVKGHTSNLAVPSLQNAKTYWDQVGCGRLFGKINTFWFTLQDAYPTTPDPSFGIVGSTLSTTPLFDLSCANVTAPPSASSSAASSASGGSGSATATGSSTIPTGGLTPNQGGGNGPASSAKTATSAAPVASNVSTLPSNGNAAAGTSGNSTSVSSSPKGTGTATGAASSSGNAAASIGGSMIAAVGAMIAVMAAL